MKTRSPHGERGLKYVTIDFEQLTYGRSPHGERGLKFEAVTWLGDKYIGRSPHGERGLKSPRGRPGG